MRYRIVEEDRNSETLTLTTPLHKLTEYGAGVDYLVCDSGQVVNWRYVRRLVPMENGDPA